MEAEAGSRPFLRSSSALSLPFQGKPLRCSGNKARRARNMSTDRGADMDANIDSNANTWKQNQTKPNMLLTFTEIYLCASLKAASQQGGRLVGQVGCLIVRWAAGAASSQT